MKTRHLGLLISAIVLLGLATAYAFTRRVPEVPIPKIPLSRAIEIVEPTLPKDGKITLIGADWFQGDPFSPRISDGTQWHAIVDSPQAYSWYLTYLHEVTKDGAVERSIFVRRVKDDATLGRLVGTRT